MRKLFCTASIFAAMLALLWSGVYFRHADTVWFCPNDWSCAVPTMQVWMIWWVFQNFIWPVTIAVSVIAIVRAMWWLAGFVCAKLRPVEAAQRIRMGGEGANSDA